LGLRIFKKTKNELDTQVERNFGKTSFSQEGEDILLSRIFEDRETGFYVDIGAHHPQRFSNTMFFYQKGWRGINIDALPGSMEAFRKERPEDINLEIAVSDKVEELRFYIFNDLALSTFSRTLAEEYKQKDEYSVAGEILLKTCRLEDIFIEHLLPGQRIDFMSVDVEGFEINVLKSNNWKIYRPQVILTEFLEFDFNNFPDTELYCFMKNNGYSFFAKTRNTVIFKLNEF
jgi:FkbM family methyltransferase